MRCKSQQAKADETGEIERAAVTDSAGRTGVQDVTLSVLDAAPKSGGGGGGALDLSSLIGLGLLAFAARRSRQAGG